MTNKLWKIFWHIHTVKGESIYKASESIEFPESTMREWVRRVGDSREGGISELTRRGRTAPGYILTEHSRFIEQLVEEKSDFTLDEISLLFQQKFPEDFQRRLFIIF